MLKQWKSEKQLKLDLRKRGGRRPGAGRPSFQGGRRHERRPHVNGREPMHVTIKLREGRPSLRQKVTLKLFKRAVERARKQGLRLIHFALISNHAHLLIEAGDNRELTQGLKSLLITLSKALNKLAGLRGRVWRDRYHLHILKTPSEVRHVLAYLFANDAKHRRARNVQLDAFSSAALIKDMRVLGSLLRGYVVSFLPTSQLNALRITLGEFCARPRAWLLLNESWAFRRGAT